MRISEIELSWFRGAAEEAILSTASKSMVIYGENGSGKSSFVDAIEHVLNEGKIGHLTHEYSGKRQEKGIINTHTPDGRKAEFRIKFRDGMELKTEIAPNGTFEREGADGVAMSTWDYQRTILRQDEVARFIWDTKGGKYSALLPLLGLQSMEITAENLRQLIKTVEQKAELKEKRTLLKEVAIKRKTVFDDATDDNILKRIEELHASYCTEKSETKDPLARCKEVGDELGARVNRFATDQRRHLVLQDIAGLDLKEDIKEVQIASLKFADAVEPLIEEKLKVLQSADIFVDKLADEDKVRCPACGRTISVEEFRTHVKGERDRLQEIIDIFETRKAAIGVLCDTLTSLKSSMDKAEIKAWRADLVKVGFTDNFAFIDALNTKVLRDSYTDSDLKSIEDKLLPLIDTAALATKDAPIEVQQLSSDKHAIEVATAIINSTEEAATLLRAEALISYLKFIEQGAREEIRIQSQSVIDGLTADIQRMWDILHPEEAIENVRLYLHEDTDKAIDIGLKFHGVELDSPRITLSEGNRNSLGLCIFLAMAKREADKDRPLFLDDVVVSLDRNHRGMIVELLVKEFNDRQVIIFTHERDWFIELRQQLDHARWIFKALMPYESPETGIRWSEKTWSFDDARAKLKSDADLAGSIARKIMDTELSLRTEGVKIRLPYLRREKNDRRYAHDFLTQLISDGERCFEKRDNGDYKSHTDAIEAFREADKLLISWANRAVHTFDVVKAEAEKLIEACEKALGFFICPDCNKAVYRLDDTSRKLVQCQCGHIRWRYGKG